MLKIFFGNPSGGAAPVAYELNLEPGSYSLTGADLAINRGLALNLESGVYSLTGADLGTVRDINLDLEPGSYALSGADLAINRGYELNLEPGVYTLAGAEIGATLVSVRGEYIIRCRQMGRR